MSRLRRPASRRFTNTKWASVIPVSLGLAIASLILFSYLADQILRKGTDRFDESVRHLVHQQSAPWLTAVMRFVTNLGDWQVILSGTLCLLVFYWYRRDGDHIRLLLVAMTGAGVLDGVLKDVFHRTRPDPFFIARPTTYSFPSGHALISLCFYGLVAGMVSHDLGERWQRIVIWSAAATLIGMIGMSRIYLGVHWPSDVLAGYAAALIWLGAMRVLALRLERSRLQEKAQGKLGDT